MIVIDVKSSMSNAFATSVATVSDAHDVITRTKSSAQCPANL